jgi:pimeloyl-ACP methyl ester carboxylesterase
MAKAAMRDLVVVLPGITGSVLVDEDGRAIWNASGEAVWSYIRSLGKNLDKLVVPPHRVGTETPSGSIRAPRLVQGIHGVFGLGRIDGYSALTRMLKQNFEMKLHDDPEAPTNYIEFPYDWRLSNRVSASALKRLIDERLPIWRQSLEGGSKAKVIFIAHSMGGLVARYYLEKLGGWPNCRALFTFGTPYRGAVAAVDYLANGYKNTLVDFTEAMRSMPSVYELLPIWRAVKTETGYQRVADMKSLPPTIDRARARDALKFHREIERAQRLNERLPQYRADRYLIFPVAGVGQPTIQSIIQDGDALVAARTQPNWIDAALDGGDGTVPRISGTPIELSEDYRETFFAERHGSLQKNSHCLDDLSERLKQTQAKGLGCIRGSWDDVQLNKRGIISLDVDPLYLPDEPVHLRARLVGNSTAGELRVRIQRTGTNEPYQQFDLTENGDGVELTLKGLTPGTYRVQVTSTVGGLEAPTDVSDVFDVADSVRE